jgi:glycosyltransferase involved in cell wall biosynthesis
METSSWLCCQLGARENYAIARALALRHALERLITDSWFPTSSLLKRISVRAAKSLKARFHEDLADVAITSFRAGLISFEARRKFFGLSGWEAVCARNRWFQRRVVRALKRSDRRGDRSVNLFAYSYAARDIFRYAKSRGWKTVLGQIDPGPVEEDIVQAEVRSSALYQPRWKPAPRTYWQHWREECEMADYIVVNSQWALDCVAQAGIARGKLKLIPLAYESAHGCVPPKKYPDRFTRGRPLRVLFLGQINARKGVTRLLEAADALSNFPVEFIMVGPIHFGELPTIPNMQWVGRVSNRDIATYFQDADVFILPTLSDGFALTQLEAVAHRVPVIASRFCGEVVRDGIDGIILEEVTSAAIRETVQKLTNDPELLAKFSQATEVRQEFTLKALGEKLLILG